MFSNFELGEFEPLIVDEVDFGEGDDAVLDAEEFKDAEVLFGLGLPSFGCSDDEDADSLAAAPAVDGAVAAALCCRPSLARCDARAAVPARACLTRFRRVRPSFTCRTCSVV